MSTTTIRPEADHRVLAAAFAEVLAYPVSAPAAPARACAEAAAVADPEAAEILRAFAATCDATPLGELQETYTRAFDLDTMSKAEPTCYPYVGHYLFDENHKRGAFILGLRRRYIDNGFSDESDLPDHLLVMLRFLAVCPDDVLADEIIVEAILPALAQIGLLAGGDAAARPANREDGGLRRAYLDLLRALDLSLLAGREGLVPVPDELQAERMWARDGDSLGISRDGCGH